MSAISLQPGTFQTRNSRLVRIKQFEMREDAPEPGSKPKRRKVWVGHLMKMDGKTEDTVQVWETSGRMVNPRGVTTPFDIIAVIRLDAPTPEPEPEPVEIPAVETTANAETTAKSETAPPASPFFKPEAVEQNK